jgi:hypothetical protein
MSLIQDNIEDQRVYEFQNKFINDPKWEEALLLTAECIAHKANSSKRDIAIHAISSGQHLINWALFIDPMLAARLVSQFGDYVWQEVKEVLGKQLRGWYSRSGEDHKENALAAMLATGRSDFADIVWPLLEHPDQQVRLRTYRAWQPFPLAILGPQWVSRISEWSEDRRTEFVHEVGWRPSAETITVITDISTSDTSPRVRAAAIEVLVWHGLSEASIDILEGASDEVLIASSRALDLLPVSCLQRIAVRLKALSVLAPEEARRNLLRELIKFDDNDVVNLVRKEVENSQTFDALERLLDYLYQKDSSWTGEWLVKQILNGKLPPKKWLSYLEAAPQELLESLLTIAMDENQDSGLRERMLSYLTFVKQLHRKTAESIIVMYLQKRKEVRNQTYDEARDRYMWSFRRAIKELPVAIVIEEVLNNYSNLDDHKVVGDIIDLLPYPSYGYEVVKVELPDGLGQQFRELLRGWIDKFRDSSGSGDLQARLATLLSLFGEPQDTEIIAGLIDWEIARINRENEVFREWLSSGRRGPQPNRGMRWTNWYIPSLLRLGGENVGDTLLRLLGEPDFLEEAALGIVTLLKKPKQEENVSSILNRPDYKEVYERQKSGQWNDQISTCPDVNRYIVSLTGRIRELLSEYQAVDKKQIIAGPLTALGDALAQIAGAEQIPLLLEVARVGGGSWGLVRMLHNLVLRGFVLPSTEIKMVVQPIIDEVLSQMKSYKYDNWYLIQTSIIILLFSDDPDSGVEVLSDLKSSVRQSYRIRDLIKLIPICRPRRASEFLVGLINDPASYIHYRRELIEALGKLATPGSRKRLIELMDDDKSIADWGSQDALTTALADIAKTDAAFELEIYELCEISVEPGKSSLLGEVLNKIGTRDAAIMGCSLLRDEDGHVPYWFDQLIEKVLADRVDSSQFPGSYYLRPKECNPLRRKLFEMAIQKGAGANIALMLLVRIEKMRLEIGRPWGEPRHPYLESRQAWPFLEDQVWR